MDCDEQPKGLPNTPLTESRQRSKIREVMYDSWLPFSTTFRAIQQKSDTHDDVHGLADSWGPGFSKEALRKGHGLEE